MKDQVRFFYLFLGLHSFLLGLFPFFLPVYLYETGCGIADISQLIGFTGLGFCLGLWAWDKTRSSSCFGAVVLSFVLEGCLLLCIVQGAPLPLLGLVNGLYSCLYWTIQRVFFYSGGSSEDSGRRFGNLQIFVLIVLKTGVLCGSVALDYVGLWSVAAISLVMIVLAALLFSRKRLTMIYPAGLQDQVSLSLKAVFSFRDGFRSRAVFAFDGIFLYLESYFWLITLFLLVRESYSRLGILIIFLALVLALLFYAIKNRIDTIPRQKLYLIAVVFYCLSWVLRANLAFDGGHTLQLCMLLVIAFCTSFFRLAFNKRFFDIAEETNGYTYLVVKSYYSQLFIGIFFLCFSAAVPLLDLSTRELLDCTYLAASAGGCLYFLFRAPQSG